MQWLLYELSRHPQIQKTLQEEVDRITQGRVPTQDDIQKMIYLKAVIKETLRLLSFLFKMLTCWSRLFWQDTSHHKDAILLLYGDLVSLITFEGTILDQVMSCFSGKNVPLAFQSVIYLYFKNVRGK